MALEAVPLTTLGVKNAEPKARPYRLHDGAGLALLVAKSGVKSWQYRYRLNGKPQTWTIGKFPGVSLKQARERAAEAAAKVAAGEHLTAVKRAEQVQQILDRATTFRKVAADWAARESRRQEWSDSHREQVEASLRNHLADLNARPVTEITARMMAPVLARVERESPSMYEKVRPRLHAVLDFCVEMGFIPGNPLPVLRRGRKRVRKNYPAITDLPGIGAILRDARASDPCKGIQRAHLLLAFTALRVSEVVGARWSEFDLDGVQVPDNDALHTFRFDKNAGNWNVPRERMKRKDPERGPHVVPLPPALLAMLREWRDADGNGAEYVCPAPRDAAKHIVAEAVEKHYHRLGLKGRHSPHSWRSAFKTTCSNAGKPRDVSETQLDHAIGDKTEEAYDRASRLELRRELMTWYESTLHAARDGATVLPIKRAEQ